MSRSDEERLGVMLVELVIWTLVLMALLAYLVVQLVELVVRVLIAHPGCKPVWLALVLVLLAAVAVAVTAGQSTTALMGFGLAVFGLYLTASIAESYYSHFITSERSFNDVLQSVQEGPWWSLDTREIR